MLALYTVYVNKEVLCSIQNSNLEIRNVTILGKLAAFGNLIFTTRVTIFGLCMYFA